MLTSAIIKSYCFYLVAGSAEPIHLHQLDEFFSNHFDKNKIKAVCKNLITINSDNDPHIPIEMAEHMHEWFGAKLILLHDAGHINSKSGYTELPVALEELRKMANI